MKKYLFIIALIFSGCEEDEIQDDSSFNEFEPPEAEWLNPENATAFIESYDPNLIQTFEEIYSDEKIDLVPLKRFRELAELSDSLNIQDIDYINLDDLVNSIIRLHQTSFISDLDPTRKYFPPSGYFYWDSQRETFDHRPDEDNTYVFYPSLSNNESDLSIRFLDLFYEDSDQIRFGHEVQVTDAGGGVPYIEYITVASWLKEGADRSLSDLNFWLTTNSGLQTETMFEGSRFTNSIDQFGTDQFGNEIATNRSRFTSSFDGSNQSIRGTIENSDFRNNTDFITYFNYMIETDSISAEIQTWQDQMKIGILLSSSSGTSLMLEDSTYFSHSNLDRIADQIRFLFN